jgi:hypothetical protein
MQNGKGSGGSRHAEGQGVVLVIVFGWPIKGWSDISNTPALHYSNTPDTWAEGQGSRGAGGKDNVQHRTLNIEPCSAERSPGYEAQAPNSERPRSKSNPPKAM